MTKIIFLPHCLRNQECEAKLDSDGYHCINCGRCEIGRFKETAEEKGYRVFIVPGGSMIKNILSKYPEPEMVIGVACETELKEGLAITESKGIKSKRLQLLKDGCINTEVDFKKIYEMIN